VEVAPGQRLGAERGVQSAKDKSLLK
jgi:hypothetical protein